MPITDQMASKFQMLVGNHSNNEFDLEVFLLFGFRENNTIEYITHDRSRQLFLFCQRF